MEKEAYSNALGLLRRMLAELLQHTLANFSLLSSCQVSSMLDEAQIIRYTGAPARSCSAKSSKACDCKLMSYHGDVQLPGICKFKFQDLNTGMGSQILIWAARCSC